MKRAREAYQAWQQADAEARAAEARLAQAWQATDAKGPPPPRVLIEDVTRLRDEANRRLSVALAAMQPGTNPGP